MITMLLVLIISSFLISSISSQHNFGLSSLLEAEQWTQTLNYSVNSPAPVWIPETSTATGMPQDWAGGKSVSVRETVPLAHVNRIQTTTVFTSQARLVTADRTPSHTGLVARTPRIVSSEPPAVNSRSTGAPQTVVDIRQSRTAKESEEGPVPTSTRNTSTTVSRTSSLHLLKTDEVLSRRTPSVKLDASEIKTEVADDSRSMSSIFRASSGDITKSSTQRMHRIRPVSFVGDMIGDDEAKHENGEHDPVPVDGDLSIGDVTVQVSDSKGWPKNSGISYSQAAISGDPGVPFVTLKNTGYHPSPPAHPAGNSEVIEWSGDPVADRRPDIRPEPCFLISEELLGFTEVTHRCSETDGLSNATFDLQPPKLEGMNGTDESNTEPLFALHEEDGSLSTTATMAPERNTTELTKRSETEIGNAINDPGNLRSMIGVVPTTALSFAATPRAINTLVSNQSSHEVGEPRNMPKYAVDIEPEELRSGDTVLNTIFQRLPIDIASGSLSDDASPSNTPVSAGLSNGTSERSHPSKSPSLRISPNLDPGILSPELLSTIATQGANAQETVAAEPSGDLETGAKDFAVVRSAPSLETSKSSPDLLAPSGEQPVSYGRPRWLWPVAVTPLLLLLTLFAVAVYWRLLRRRRRKLDISGSSGGVVGVATSPWSQPAQPVLHSSRRPAFDPDESLAPPPPSYSEHQSVVVTSASFVSLELEESPHSSRKTSATDVSVGSV